MQLLEIFRKSPFARLLFFYAIGILAAHFSDGLNMDLFRIPAAILFVLLSVLLIFIGWRVNYHTGWLSGLLSGIILFMAGFANTDIRYQYAKREINKGEARGLFVLQIIDAPEIKEKTVKATVRMKGGLIHGEWDGSGHKLLVHVEKDSAALEIKPGDWLIAEARVGSIPPPGNPDEFDYRKYLAARNVYKQAYLKSGSWKISPNHKQKSIKSTAGRMQGNLLQAYQKIGLNSTLYSILAALTLGYKNDLDVHTKQAFSRAGVMHVMALSGFNVAIIALALGYTLNILRRSATGKACRTAIIILIIWVFAFVTGLSPSVTRAAVMISFVMTGKLLNRHINTHNILFASAFFLLAISPALLTDVSFQLSFAAVMGILVYHPILYRFLVFKNFLADRIWQLFTVSCAAQLSTLPLTLYYFHQFPVYFWLTNIYVIPWVSVIIIVSGIFLLVSFLNPVALVVGKILAILLEGLYKSVLFTEMLPYALLDNIHISIHQSMLLFVLTMFFSLFILYKKSWLLFLSLSMFLVFQLLGTSHNLLISKQKIFMVSNIKSTSALCFISGRKGMMWINSVDSSRFDAVHYALSNFWIERHVSDHLLYLSDPEIAVDEISGLGSLHYQFPWLGNNVLIECDGRRMAYLQDDQFTRHQSPRRLNMDLIVVSGKVKPDLKGITDLLHTDLLILDSSVNRFQALQWKKACERLLIPCWNVAEKGAYLLEINKSDTRF